MHRKLLSSIVLIGSAISLLGCSNKTTYTNPNIDKEMPSDCSYQIGDYVYGGYSFTDFKKVEHSLSDALKTKKLVVINMWATWCSPCNYEFPYVQEAYEKYNDNVEFFALSDELNAAIKTWYEDYNHSYTFPMGKDTGMKMFKAFGVEAYPTSVFIDRDGRIDYAIAGGLDCWEDIFEYYTSDSYEFGKASINNRGELVINE